MVVIKSCVLLPALMEKGERAIYKIVTRFLARFSLVYRMGDFIENACARLVERNPRFIINMDQTPVYFSMHSKKTLSKIGLRTVPILTSTNDTCCVTVAVMITASGDQLLPMVIFKGSPTGTIAKTEIPLFNPTLIYDVQKMRGWTST